MYNTADIHLALPETVFQASASQGLCPLGQRKGWSCEEGVSDHDKLLQGTDDHSRAVLEGKPFASQLSGLTEPAGYSIRRPIRKFPD